MTTLISREKLSKKKKKIGVKNSFCNRIFGQKFDFYNSVSYNFFEIFVIDLKCKQSVFLYLPRIIKRPDDQVLDKTRLVQKREKTDKMKKKNRISLNEVSGLEF